MASLDLRPAIAPYDVDGMLAYLAAHATPGVEHVDVERRVHRRLELIDADDPASAVIVTLDLSGAEGPTAAVSAVPGSGRRAPGAKVRRVLEARCAHLLDLDADPTRLFAELGRDPLLGPIVDRCPGVRAAGAWDAFQMIVKVIIGQQVSVAGASTMTGRLAQAYGVPVDTGDEALTHCFPGPSRLIDAPMEDLGFIGARARAIRGVAAAVLDGELDLSAEPDDSAGFIDRLVARPGIGPWTATIVAFRVSGDRDLFPPGDLALRRAAGELSADHDGPVADDELVEWSRRWSPLRSYGAHLLWRSTYLD